MAMAVTVEEAVANLKRRWANEVVLDSSAAQKARACLPFLAKILRERGAKKVVLFGSLAEGRFHCGSDIDLAVEGLDERSIFGLMYDLTLAAERQVNLVPIESAPASLAARIREAGEIIP